MKRVNRLHCELVRHVVLSCVLNASPPHLACDVMLLSTLKSLSTVYYWPEERIWNVNILQHGELC